MTSVTDVALATVGLLTIAVYVVLLVMGAAPEQALLLAVSGGLVLGLLVSMAVHVVASAEERPHSPALGVSFGPGNGEGAKGETGPAVAKAEKS